MFTKTATPTPAPRTFVLDIDTPPTTHDADRDFDPARLSLPADATQGVRDVLVEYAARVADPLTENRCDDCGEMTVGYDGEGYWHWATVVVSDGGASLPRTVCEGCSTTYVGEGR